MTYTLIEDLPESNLSEVMQPVVEPVMETGEMDSYSSHGYDNFGFESPERSMNKYVLPRNSPCCIDVANHIEACPICSRHYCNDTKYLVIIFLLIVVCLLMLKKILNV